MDEYPGQAVLDKGRLASPTCEEASWDQLEDATVSDLSQRGKNFSVQVYVIPPELTKMCKACVLCGRGRGRVGGVVRIRLPVQHKIKGSCPARVFW